MSHSHGTAELSAHTAAWISQRRGFDDFSADGLQVPKVALMLNAFHGPHRLYTEDEKRQYYSVVANIHATHARSNLSWIKDHDVLDKTERRVLRVMLQDPATQRTRGVTQTLSARKHNPFATRWDHGHVTGLAAMTVVLESGFGDPFLAYWCAKRHDDGQPGLHHNAEEALDVKMKEVGFDGFDHAKRSGSIIDASVATVSYSSVVDFVSVVADSGRHHSWPLKPDTRLEAALTTWGDPISYVSLDVPNGLLGGILSAGQVAEVAPWATEFFGLKNHPAFQGKRELTGLELHQLTHHIWRTLALDLATQLRDHHLPASSLEAGVALTELRSITSNLIISRASHRQWQQDQREVVEATVDKLLAPVPDSKRKERTGKIVDQMVTLTERELLRLCARVLDKDSIKSLGNAPLDGELRRPEPRRSRSDALLALDDLIAVDFALPGGNGVDVQLAFSDAYTVMNILAAPHLRRPVRDDQGQRIEMQSVDISVLGADPVRRAADVQYKARVTLGGFSGRGAKRALDPQSAQAKQLQAVSTAVYDAVRELAREHKALETRPSWVKSSPHEQSVKQFFKGHESLRDLFLDPTSDADALLRGMEQACREYALEQRAVQSPHFFDASGGSTLDLTASMALTGV